jgi:trehalose 6-phosphate phosphatase
VPAPTAETLAQALAPLTESPERAGLFFDVDGTLAPIVARPEDSHVPEQTSRLLGALAPRYGAVGCISGRSALEARRLVGVAGIWYAGAHGAELIEAGATRPTILPEFESWARQVREFTAERNDKELRLLRIRIEDKGPISAFHWRGAPDEDAAEEALLAVAADAEAHGFHTHRGRKVLEIRPPLALDKGRGIRRLLEGLDLDTALYAGDDVTDLDAFAALRALRDDGALSTALCVGVASDETPPEVAEGADLLVDGPAGVRALLTTLAT